MKITLRIFLIVGLCIFACGNSEANPGDIYVTDNTSIHKYTPDGVGSVFAVVPTRPRGLAFDKAGNLFVTTLDGDVRGDGDGRILKFASDGTYTVFARGLDLPQGIAFDEGGSLFVTNSFGNSVVKISPNGAAKTFATFDAATSEPFALACEVGQNFAMADAGFVSGIYMISPSGRVSTFVLIDSAIDLRFDSAGNLFVTQVPGGSIEPGNCSVIKVAPDGTQTTFVTGLPSVRGLAFDADGNLFVAGHVSNNLYKITPDGTVSVFASDLNSSQRVAVEGIFLPDQHVGNVIK